ncbi:MAG: DUF4386 family protein [Micropepsaceae bacterium]
MTASVFPARRDLRAAGIALAAFAVLTNVPYSALIALFDYDDVLRRPSGEVLTLFRAGGEALVLAWWGFAMAAVGFAIAAGLAGEALARRGVMPRWATMLGVASGLIQAVALLRWVFAVPHLAAAYAGGDAAAQAGAIATYETLNLYLGAGLGEHLGQMLLVIWTGAIALAFTHLGGTLKIIGWIGFATLPLWLVAQTEMLSLSLPSLPVIEAAPIAFMGWMAWLIAAGAAMVLRRAD